MSTLLTREETMARLKRWPRRAVTRGFDYAGWCSICPPSDPNNGQGDSVTALIAELRSPIGEPL